MKTYQRENFEELNSHFFKEEFYSKLKKKSDELVFLIFSSGILVRKKSLREHQGRLKMSPVSKLRILQSADRSKDIPCVSCSRLCACKKEQEFVPSNICSFLTFLSMHLQDLALIYPCGQIYFFFFSASILSFPSQKSLLVAFNLH
jgi:hypothetical protein